MSYTDLFNKAHHVYTFTQLNRQLKHDYDIVYKALKNDKLKMYDNSCVHIIVKLIWAI